MAKKDELLKVLDMTEGEQWKWVSDNLLHWDCDHGWYYKQSPIEGIADLAFRLRDEARKTNFKAWIKAIYLIASIINHSPITDYGEECVPIAVEQWAQHIILNQGEYPLLIIWIIAALSAKEQAK